MGSGLVARTGSESSADHWDDRGTRVLMAGAIVSVENKLLGLKSAWKQRIINNGSKYLWSSHSFYKGLIDTGRAPPRH